MSGRPTGRRPSVVGLLGVIAAGVACIGCSGSSPNAATASTPPGTAPSTPQSTTPVAGVTAAPSSTTEMVATSTPSTTEPTIEEVRRVFPVLDAARAGFGDTHHDYPATDIFHPDGCGAALVAPVDGTVLDLRRTDPWTAAVDDPATRGGIVLSILGDDGVRYYMAHFRRLADALEPGVRVAAGDVVGEMGDTGRAGACHLHFAISPPCDDDEWWVRRGVIWPADYLRAWRAGENLSPVDEVESWANAHPDACIVAP